MATPNPSINPMATTNAAGLFQLNSDGMVQGTMMPDPATRNALAQGILAASETVVMWGGVAVNLAIAVANLGPSVSRATLASNIAGFSITNQAYNGITTPNSAPEQYGSNMSVQFLRIGSGARAVLGCDPGFAALIAAGGVAENVQCSWDFARQMVVPYAPAYSGVTISGATWANTAGGQTTFTVSADMVGVLTAGDVIDVSGVVSTGATTNGYNGTFTVVSVNTALTVYTIVVTQARAASPGTYASGGALADGGGALGVKINRVNVGNSMTISRDSTTGDLSWNPNGSAVEVIL